MPLFELGDRKPTTRDIALTVKAGGAEALTGADLRADDARYQEVSCKSAAARTAATTASRAATTSSSR